MRLRRLSFRGLTCYRDTASIDFEDTIQKQGFTIDNPQAQGSCACGDSFH